MLFQVLAGPKWGVPAMHSAPLPLPEELYGARALMGRLFF
jgi:hypothetical protein